MLIQRTPPSTVHPQTVAPHSFPTPPHELIALQHAANPAPSTPYAELGPATFTVGIDDPEPADLSTSDKSQLEMTSEDVKAHVIGWDNESPRREMKVGKFKAEWRGVTNGEFYDFWKKQNAGAKSEKEKLSMPGSWVEMGGEMHVSLAGFYYRCERPLINRV
jgi:formylglycine-generating enzyme required for sulfatase activity